MNQPTVRVKPPKAPGELIKGHRFVKGAITYNDNNRSENYISKLIAKAVSEDLNFVDTNDFISEAVINRLKKDGNTVFGSVIRWNA